MNQFTLSTLITCICTLGLGIFVLHRDINSKLYRFFGLYSLSIAVWSLFLFINTSTNSKIISLFCARALHIGAIFIPIFCLHFYLIFLSKVHGINKKILKLAYTLGFIFLSFNFFSPLFVKDVVPKHGLNYYMVAGNIYFTYFTFFLIFTTYSLYLLFNAYSQSMGIKRAQLKYLFWSSVGGYVGGVDNFLLIWDIKIFPLFPYGNYAIAIYVFIVTYAIVKHQLMDISIVIRKGTVYTYLLFLVLAPCMFFIILAQKVFFGQISPLFSFVVFCTLFLATLTIIRIKPEIEEYVEKLLFKKKYEHKMALSELSKIVISFLDEKELFQKTSDVLTEALGIEKISFFLLDRERKAYTLRASQNLGDHRIREFPEDDLSFKWLEETSKTVVKEELERFANDPKIKSIIERLDSMESEVCIPLITRTELIGIINLGKKTSGDMYSHEDLELFAHLASQASVALENIRLYEDMKRTQSLMRRSDRLAALGSLTAGLAHEIRNPLVAVKTFLQLLPDRYEDEEFRGDFLNLTTSEVERITTLVSELLDFARPSEPQFKKADVNEVLEKVIHLVTVEAKKRDIVIDTKLKETGEVMLDEEQIKQVFLNIFLNAVDAISGDGNILVTSRSIQRNGVDYVRIEIADTGQGIPKKILDRIFDPFFTTKEKGSGLGLSICHQIVQEHNGYIEVGSKLGKGTTFFVNLPSAK